MRFSLVALLLLAGTASAEEFQCQAGFSWERGDEIVVTAVTDDADSDIGIIEVAGTLHVTTYEVQGFNHRWDFGPLTDGGGHTYAFVIEPDGTGRYFDFSLADEDGRVRSSQIYICKQTE